MELAAVADRITVILPWGSLLRSVAAPEIDSLRHIAHLCLPEAAVEIVFSHDERDARQRAPLGAGGLDEEHITTTLPRLYDQAGLPIVAAGRISQRELADCQTTWGKRLAFSQPRKVWRLRARYAGPGDDHP